MKSMVKSFTIVLGVGVLCFGGVFLVSCASQRQGLVCEEIEYRYNTMSYSPDQRAFMEDELRACREEEAKKKGTSSQSQKSIYERYASQDTTKTVYTAADSAAVVVPRDSTAAIPSDSSITSAPETPSDSSATVDSTAATEGPTTTDSTTVEVPQE